jgi:capsular polysaccharide transport system permease protein
VKAPQATKAGQSAANLEALPQTAKTASVQPSTGEAVQPQKPAVPNGAAAALASKSDVPEVKVANAADPKGLSKSSESPAPVKPASSDAAPVAEKDPGQKDQKAAGDEQTANAEAAPKKPDAKAKAKAKAKSLKAPAPEQETKSSPVKAPPLQPALDDALRVSPLARARKKVNATQLSFLLAVMLPVLLVSLYYLFVSSDQYRSEMRFSVRGTERSTVQNLGLDSLIGGSIQAEDAYIVIDYIHSMQVLIDMNEKFGVDVRQYFSKPDIDFVYRIDADMPLDEFISYWRWMVDASFNSTTKITTFQVTAFTGEDAAAIASAVMRASEQLVNELSSKARLQLISSAQNEVSRTEERLVEARQAVALFRDMQKIVDPTMTAQSDQAIIQELEKTIIELKSRRASLLSSVDASSPSVRVMDRQIASYTTQLEAKRQGIGTGGQGDGNGQTLTTQLTEYNALVLEQEFAEKAYTAALASLETSQAEARRQDRYFAVAVAPSAPEISLYPTSLLNTFLAFCALCVLWLIGYIVMQAVRDHTA